MCEIGEERAMGNSKEGKTIKTQMLSDAHGNLICFEIIGGNLTTVMWHPNS